LKRRPAAAGLESKWKVLTTVTMGIFMIIADSTIVNISFPALRSGLRCDLSQAQWVISIYVLTLGITTPVSGFLADRFDIKRIYLLGLAIFTFGSLLCGVAPSLGLLIAARALQGFGGGMAQPLGAAQLYRAFPPKEQGTAFGILGIALVVAPASGHHGRLVGRSSGLAGDLLRQCPIGFLAVFLGSRFLSDVQAVAPPVRPLGVVTAVVGFRRPYYAQHPSLKPLAGPAGRLMLLGLGSRCSSWSWN
jgi:MFS family permease